MVGEANLLRDETILEPSAKNTSTYKVNVLVVEGYLRGEIIYISIKIHESIRGCSNAIRLINF